MVYNQGIFDKVIIPPQKAPKTKNDLTQKHLDIKEPKQLNLFGNFFFSSLKKICWTK
jgi:hypothetical protein